MVRMAGSDRLPPISGGRSGRFARNSVGRRKMAAALRWQERPNRDAIIDIWASPTWSLWWGRLDFRRSALGVGFCPSRLVLACVCPFAFGCGLGRSACVAVSFRVFLGSAHRVGRPCSLVRHIVSVDPFVIWNKSAQSASYSSRA